MTSPLKDILWRMRIGLLPSMKILNEAWDQGVKYTYWNKVFQTDRHIRQSDLMEMDFIFETYKYFR